MLLILDVNELAATVPGRPLVALEDTAELPEVPRVHLVDHRLRGLVALHHRDGRAHHHVDRLGPRDGQEVEQPCMVHVGGWVGGHDGQGMA